MEIKKDSLLELINSLSEKQIEYLYHLANALFCKASD